MARARLLKPGFFKNENLAECSFPARLLFAGLWTLADRSGRLEDRPKKIKMEIFPGDEVDCDALLNELSAHEFISRYQVDVKNYIQIKTFSAHQKPHQNEKESVIPEEGSATKVESPSNQGTTKSGLNLEPLTLNLDAVAAYVALGQKISKITGWADSPSWFGDYSRCGTWLANGWDEEKDILPTVEKLMRKRTAKGQGPPSCVSYFEQAIADAYATRTKPVPEGKPDEGFRRNNNGSNGKSRAVREIIAEEFAQSYGPPDGSDAGRLALTKL